MYKEDLEQMILNAQAEADRLADEIKSRMSDDEVFLEMMYHRNGMPCDVQVMLMLETWKDIDNLKEQLENYNKSLN